MQKVLIFAAGAAAGFVLGTRSGRQSYEKMRHQSLELWHNPTVQEKVSEATEIVKDKAPQVQHKVGELAKKATHRGTDTSATGAPNNGVSLEEGAGRTPTTTEPATVTSPTEGKHTQSPN
ncbi:YtxH domain-containing protein [Rhodococcus sp. IEGM 248]|uniref:YtxH domain-containing protein n=1 Tax=Rhodococcus opacus TaxID=37919 RepID=UPI0013C24E71|nr:YtxH domain-containing protein [Rhodococcus opacus]MDV7087056.1 YtxH domain-containing protein [Rhodococcus opacus]NDV09085.1 YtxH domain-containing protein [Rhodococcus sp. IEGM 248]